ncbi:MAG TPA: SUMF1/EgtB/PvdO family nonheme iron enzyme, partial [Armatimonadota bacterium]|nr:SUMF1/EgtB/PvdO family nonheme iron enzyme [Armatimonadota bacterium]
TDGRIYPWGNEWDAAKCHCSKRDCGDAGGTAPVGSYPAGASPYGVQDMAGNVWEWCESWYDDSEDERVLRGGSWDGYDENGFRGANRDSGSSGSYWYGIDVGFRCGSFSPGP